MTSIYECRNPNSVSVGGTAPGAPTVKDIWWDTVNQMWRWWDGSVWQTISASPPATATSPGIKGQMAFDSDYLYICTATNVWVRAVLATW